MNIIKNLLLAGMLLFCAGHALADDEILKPFVLGSKGPGNFVKKAEAASVPSS